ncbi:MAG: hypothetical protein M0011_07410 [Elusimicrobia bacterium]|nr:hypothetical protein [Elusimicrobiota bacterium]
MTSLMTAVLLAASPAFSAPQPSSCFDNAVPCAASSAALPAPALPAPLAAGRPVVISIVGIDFTELGFGKLELSYLKKILHFFRPGAGLDESEFRTRLSSVGQDLEMAEYYKKSDAGAAAAGKYPDNYLDSRLADVLPADKYEIVPVRWSRDPDESEQALPLVEAEIRNTFAKASSEGRPVYLVAHSWGTMLAHTALNRMAVSDPQVRIDKLITLGSPLVPSTWWMKIFTEHEVNAGHLQSFVSKPANVGYWVNLWAGNDYFSNEIKAADKNIREDGFTEDLVRRVKAAAQQDHSLGEKALRDLFFLKSLKSWHFAYIFDYQVYLKTLKESHEKAIFAPVISGELGK